MRDFKNSFSTTDIYYTKIIENSFLLFLPLNNDFKKKWSSFGTFKHKILHLLCFIFLLYNKLFFFLLILLKGARNLQRISLIFSRSDLNKKITRGCNTKWTQVNVSLRKCALFHLIKIHIHKHNKFIDMKS